MHSALRYCRPLSIQIVKISTAITRPKHRTITIMNRNEYTKYDTRVDDSRKYSSAQNHVEDEIVDCDYVKRSTEKQDILIVDVREPEEIKEHGKIPNSINIPLGNINDALNKMSDKDFQSAYKKGKPCKDTEIIFYCMIGKRSGMAQQNAKNLGFQNAKNYLGSWYDWASKK